MCAQVYFIEVINKSVKWQRTEINQGLLALSYNCYSEQSNWSVNVEDTDHDVAGAKESRGHKDLPRRQAG